MAEVIKKVIQIDAGNSPKTVKELKNQISQLRDSLVTLDSTSDEYAAVVQQLTQAQQTLTTVMNAGKASVTAADGSYNALVQTMKTLQAEWKATADEARRAELGEQIAEINEQLKELDGTIGNSQRKVGSYKDEIVAAFGEIQDASKKTEVLAGSTAQSYSEAWGQMQKATEQTRAKFESVQKIAAGVTSAYAAVQGATALLGIENSNLEKTFVKVQSAMALAQGVGGMKDLVEGVSQAKVAFGGAFTAAKTFITGLNGIKAAIVGTGIGALVVALGLLVANWDKLSSKAHNSEEIVNKLSKNNANAIKQIEQANSAMEREIRIAEANGAKSEEIINKRIEQNVKNIDKLNERLNKTKEQLGVFEAVNEGVLNREKEIEETKEEIKLLEEEIDKYKAIQESLNVDKQVDDIKKQNEALEEQRRIYENIQNAKKAELDRVAEIENGLKDERLLRTETYLEEKALLEKYGRDTTALTQKYWDDLHTMDKAEMDEEYQDWEKHYNKLISQKDKELNKLQKSNINSISSYDESNEGVKNVDNNADGWIEENELDSYKAYLDGRLDLLQANTEAENELIQSKINLLKDQLAVQELLGQDTSNTTAQIESLNEQILDNNDKLAEATEDNNKKKEKSDEQYAQSKKKRDKLVADFSISTASSTLKNLSSIAGEESKAGKAMAIASATIDTYQAANAAYKSMAGIPVVGPALGAAAAAAAVIAGIANVKQILKTDPENGDGNIASTASATPNLSLDSMMPMQYTRNLQTDTELDEMNQSTKVYVTEEDITTTQNKVAVSEQNASF